MNKKRKVPIKQLLEDGKKAKELLIERGIIAKDSILDKINKDPNSPNLPGIPAYLPHEYTLKQCQRILYIIVRDWMAEEKDVKKVDDIKLFFTFLQKQMYDLEGKFHRQEEKTGKIIKTLKKSSLLADIFAPTERKETTKAIHKFFVDSLAIAVIVKRNDCVSDYVDWFLNEWTPSLIEIWKKQHEKNISNNKDTRD